MLKAALVFPGQGSQYVGMGKWLLDNDREAGRMFEEANDVLGFNIRLLCMDGSLSELSKTENAQPAILTVSLAAYRFYCSEYGIMPRYAAGHSLGEYSALAAAGALSFGDALRIVRARGQLMEEAASSGQGTMVSVKGMNRGHLEQVCEELSSPEVPVVIACYNSAAQAVVSLRRETVPKLTERLEKLGAVYTPLRVSGPFHSPLMQQAADKLADVLKQYSFQPVAYPVISNASALPYASHSRTTEGLLRQMTQPVRWEQTMEYLVRHKVNVIIELGPRAILRNITKDIDASIAAFSLDQEKDRLELGKLKDLPEFRMSYINHCLKTALSSRNYNFDEKAYETGVAAPYRQLKAMAIELEHVREVPTWEQMRSAAAWVDRILAAKGTPEDERTRRMNELNQILSKGESS